MTAGQVEAKVWMRRATELVGRVYEDFMASVVERHVLRDRLGPLGSQQQKAIEQGRQIDPRVPRLMAISGKGGWHPDPVKRDRYAKNANVTLLDHLLSTLRGAMLLYALDCLERTPDMDEARLRTHLYVIAVLAFLHDLDKMLELERGAELRLEDVEAALQRYGIPAFLEQASLEPLTADQVRYLIEKVEGSEAGRHFPAVLPPQAYERLTGYVGLADKLDGIWLSSDSEKGGLSGVLRRLRNDQTLHGDLLRHWKAVDLFDPHHPFLLDELQRWLSFMSLAVAGIPPLIEVHQDGRLFVLLPEANFSEITKKAISGLCKGLPFDLDIVIPKLGIPSLYNGKPDHTEMQELVGTLDFAKLSRLFLVRSNLKSIITSKLDNLLQLLGLSPSWPQKTPGALASLYDRPDQLEENARCLLRQTAHLVLLLNIQLPVTKKNGLPSYAVRESELLNVVALQCPEEKRPDWVAQIDHDASRRILTALWVTSLTDSHPDLQESIWGPSGLLQNWLEGIEEKPGFNQFIEGRGAQVAKAIEQRFQCLISGKIIIPEDESHNGRCLFTDEPVAFDDCIGENDGLYCVKAAAFSGRDNRPETLNLTHGHTNMSPVSIAEYKLRANAQGRPSGDINKLPVPVLISSPSTIGLFGGLTMGIDKAMRGMSIYDIARYDTGNGLTINGIELYQGRWRIARFENLPERLYVPKTAKKPATGQIIVLRLMLQACRRVGRPLHVLRGLPTPQRAFFHYDAMPRLLAELIGGNSLRLEQIPGALQRLEIAQALLEAKGLGYEVFNLYAIRKTRFKAICLAWSHLRDTLKHATDKDKPRLERNIILFLNEYFNYEDEIMTSSNEDSALVLLGRKAATIQKRPWNGAASEEMRVFNLCLDSAIRASIQGIIDMQSLTYAIQGELDSNLRRKQETFLKNREALQKACLDTAELFVRDVWNRILKGKPPKQSARRILGSIYRMAFLQAAQASKESQNQP